MSSGRSDSGPSDRDLLAAHRDGDPDAFGELFRRHRDRLWAVALRTCGNPEDAADALQDAMVSAWSRADGFRGESAVTTWLHRVVVNACLDRLRRNRVRRAEALPDDLDRTPAEALVAAATAGPGPDAAAVAAERRRTVLAALARLSPDQRAALVLVDMEGYSVEETARILDCPTGTVKSRCARGRSRLLTLLEGTGLLADTSHRKPGRTAAPDLDTDRDTDLDTAGGTP